MRQCNLLGSRSDCLCLLLAMAAKQLGHGLRCQTDSWLRPLVSRLILPSTGDAKAEASSIHAVKGKLTGMALRAPAFAISMFGLTAEIKKETTRKKSARKTPLRE